MQRKFLAWLAVAPIFCQAQIVNNVGGWDYSEPVQKQCYADGQGQLGANICMQDSLRLRDEEMNRLYGYLESTLTVSNALRDSQRAWLQFRDSYCTVRVSGMDETGSAYGFVRDSCHLDLTLKRIMDLKLLEANLDCGGCPVRKEK